jgi:hypothetical protein
MGRWMLSCLLILLTACASGTNGSTCAPYGSIWPTAMATRGGDPRLGATRTATPVEPPTPPSPTCTPPWPTWTPRPTPEPHTERPSSPIEIATAPQNLTLSPGSESLQSVHIAPGASPVAVTWHEQGESRIGIHTSFGWSISPAPAGVGGALAVVVSPGGRQHALGAEGLYTYNDEDGQGWAEPVAILPAGSDPRLLLLPSGLVQACTLVNGTLYTAVQEPDRWTVPQALARGVSSYEIAQDGARGLIIVTGSGGTRLYENGQEVAAWGEVESATVTARGGQTVVGLKQEYRASIAWQVGQGGAWRTCLIQEITNTDWTASGMAKIGRVYGIPAIRQQQIVALWIWSQPGHDGRGQFPFIATSHTPRHSCDPTPALQDAQRLYLQFAGPPGLFDTHAPQRDLRLSLQGDRGVIAFEGLQWNQGRDIYVAEFNPDTILSLTYLGDAR